MKAVKIIYIGQESCGVCQAVYPRIQQSSLMAEMEEDEK